MDKQLREQIKHDRFQEEVVHGVTYLRDHRAAVRKYGGVVAGVLVLVLAVYGYMNYTKRSRQEALRKAAIAIDGVVGDSNPTGGPTYKTQADKENAGIKAYTEVAEKYSGTKEGQLARYYAGTLYCDQGKVTECEAAFKQAAAGGDAEAASLAKLSLATLYLSQGKNEQAEPILNELVQRPTTVVSKEQSQLLLARAIMKKRPNDARIILESLQALDRPPVTRAAVGLLGELMGVPQSQQ